MYRPRQDCWTEVRVNTQEIDLFRHLATSGEFTILRLQLCARISNTTRHDRLSELELNTHVTEPWRGVHETSGDMSSEHVAWCVDLAWREQHSLHVRSPSLDSSNVNFHTCIKRYLYWYSATFTCVHVCFSHEFKFEWVLGVDFWFGLLQICSALKLKRL